ncbi:recombination protein RecR [Candidatus Berkelbacteria bacterium RIFCSPHIGHO2_12_FULL_36_9]|uniref:Recombination protein RecR n=1 Tax=Candidatus Berkelbacteria bacterium RIFCSPHIGHO2_12_FULL_36_9 TaxID=1797469 RepID=A0A1F5EHF5_9BACT|nr:MAG: recombination protein RecR [Candidatus Berkelbacteria bacterium RIFCSPHIGHO2_12_FULL_36_9]
MLPKSIQNLIEQFSKLPGIGPKTAARLTFYMLSKSESDIEQLGNSVSNLKKGLVFCQDCYNISNTSPCEICSDEKREKNKICVVEEPLDIVALNKTDYNGIYHVLGGVISPIDGIGPDNLRIAQLLNKLQVTSYKLQVQEVILATDPSLEGEATAMYILQQVQNLQKSGKINKEIKITRIARGLPVGGDLEYADEVTLKRALEGRREY